MAALSDIRLRNISLAVIAFNLVYFIFPFPPIILRLLLIALCLYVILFKSHKFSTLEKWMLFFSAINIVYFFIAFATKGYSYVTSIGNNLCAFLPLCLFSYLAKKGTMTEKFITVMTIILLLACVAYYIHYEQMRVLVKELDEGDSTTINASTVFLMMIPLLFYEKRRVLLYAELGICVFFIVAAVKRGNIVAAALPLAILLRYQFKDSKKNALSLFVLLCFVIGGAYYLQEYLSSSYYFQQRLEDTLNGNSSGRDRIYVEAFSIWEKSNGFHLFFGNGFRAVTRTIGTPAHSDWIEILVDNGVFGVMFYLGIFVCFFSVVRHTHSLPEKLILFSAFLIWFAKSIYSMAYVESHMYLLMIAVGLAMWRPKQEMEVFDESH